MPDAHKRRTENYYHCSRLYTAGGKHGGVDGGGLFHNSLCSLCFLHQSVCLSFEEKYSWQRVVQLETGKCVCLSCRGGLARVAANKSQPG